MLRPRATGVAEFVLESFDLTELTALGSIILIDTEAPGFGIDISVIVTFAAISALVFIFVIGMAIKARRKKVVSGLEELLGGEATVINGFEQQGTVSICFRKGTFN